MYFYTFSYSVLLAPLPLTPLDRWIEPDFDSLELLWLHIWLDFLAVLFIVLRSKFGGNLPVKGGKVGLHILPISEDSGKNKNH